MKLFRTGKARLVLERSALRLCLGLRLNPSAGRREPWALISHSVICDIPLVVSDDLGVYLFDFNVVLLVLYILLIVLGISNSIFHLQEAVMERTYFLLFTPETITVLPLIWIRMIQFFDRRVAIFTEEAVRAEFPGEILTLYLLHALAVFWGILEDLRRTAEITHMMSINTAFRVVRVLPLRTPACLVPIHVKSECIHCLLQLEEI